MLDNDALTLVKYFSNQIRIVKDMNNCFICPLFETRWLLRVCCPARMNVRSLQSVILRQNTCQW